MMHHFVTNAFIQPYDPYVISNEGLLATNDYIEYYVFYGYWITIENVINTLTTY